MFHQTLSECHILFAVIVIANSVLFLSSSVEVLNFLDKDSSSLVEFVRKLEVRVLNEGLAEFLTDVEQDRDSEVGIFVCAFIRSAE